MQSSQSVLPLRDDTLLGVCHGIGEEFGFDPLWLRILFATLLLWNFKIVIGAYLVIGMALLVARLMFPVRRATTAPARESSSESMASEAPVEAASEELAIAA